MFHSSHIHVPRNRRPSALRTFITSSSFGPPDTKEPLRRGILLTAVAFVLLLIGSILTWLGFNDVFGGNMSMTGPLLIALSLLMLLLSFRQFLLARKRNNTNTRSSMQLDSVNRESMTAVVVNRDDGLHPSTIIVDRYNRIGYDGSITVHRHWEDDCAPPSYQEVTRFSSRSNTPSCMVHDDQDELPPTYEETMCSSIYRPAGLITPSRPAPAPAAPAHLGERSSASASEGGEGVGSSRSRERDVSQSSVAHAGVYSHFSDKRSPATMKSSGLELEMGRRRGVGPGVAVRNQSVSGIVMPLPQHSLPLPHSQHMSAPASPRQLSAPPSPHPFSAPPSPRQVSPHPNMTTTPPPQYMSPSGSSMQLSTPPSLHLLTASHSHALSRPPSPHFSAPPPSSPPCRPMSGGQHSLTPPPQYTSCPPSPRQVSAPASPLVFSSPPRSPCFMPSNAPLPAMHPLSPQPLAHHHHHPFPPPHSSMSHQLPGPLQQPFPAPTHSARTWDPAPQHAGSQEAYTCFTYNFVTPVSDEASLSASSPLLQGHTTTTTTASFSPFPRDGPAVPYPQPALPREAGPGYSRPLMGEARSGFPPPPRADVQAMGSPMYGVGSRGETAMACVPSLSDMSLQRGTGSSPSSSFTSRTDIQANI